jgi:hypothetical protein
MPDLRTGNARSSLEITTQVVRAQVEAMGAEVFELGLFRMDTAEGSGPPMLPRTWDVAGLIRSIPWLRLQNAQGRNIYIRPQGEHNLTLIDDLKADAVERMKREGFQPALAVETSPGNFQAWLKHPERLPKDVGTAAARALAERFDGDRKAADWRHFGRLAGFTNRKPKYQGADGRFPFVRMIEATGTSYPEAGRFLAGIRNEVEETARERAQQAARAFPERRSDSRPKTIEEFRSNNAYGGDGTRIDLAYSIYALSHGVSEADVLAALRSRNLSHKGNDRRQNEYLERTIRKANSLRHDRSSLRR